MRGDSGGLELQRGVEERRFKLLRGDSACLLRRSVYFLLIWNEELELGMEERRKGTCGGGSQGKPARGGGGISWWRLWRSSMSLRSEFSERGTGEDGMVTRSVSLSHTQTDILFFPSVRESRDGGGDGLPLFIGPLHLLPFRNCSPVTTRYGMPPESRFLFLLRLR